MLTAHDWRNKSRSTAADYMASNVAKIVDSTEIVGVDGRGDASEDNDISLSVGFAIRAPIRNPVLLNGELDSI